MKFGFSKTFWRLDVETFIAIVLASLVGPWWIFAVVCWVGGLERARRGGDTSFPAALLAGLSWLFFAVTRDSLEGFRISKRLGGFFGLKSGTLLELAMFVGVFVLGYVMASSGRTIGRELFRAQNPPGK